MNNVCPTDCANKRRRSCTICPDRSVVLEKAPCCRKPTINRKNLKRPRKPSFPTLERHTHHNLQGNAEQSDSREAFGHKLSIKENDHSILRVGSLKQFMVDPSQLYLHEFPRISLKEQSKELQKTRPLFDPVKETIGFQSVFWPFEESNEPEKGSNNLKLGGVFWGGASEESMNDQKNDDDEEEVVEELDRVESAFLVHKLPVIALLDFDRSLCQYVISRVSKLKVIELTEDFCLLTRNAKKRPTCKIMQLLKSCLTSIETSLTFVRENAEIIVDLLNSFRDACAIDRLAAEDSLEENNESALIAIGEICSHESMVMEECKFLRQLVERLCYQLQTTRNRLIDLHQIAATVIISEWIEAHIGFN